MIKCFKCQIDKNESEFHWKNKSKGTRQGWCKPCHSIWTKKNYAGLSVEAKKAKAALAAENVLRNKIFVLEYLRKHPCCTCGECDPVVLEFNHLEGKEGNISDMIKQGRSIINLQAEMDKCEVLCANCHRRHTAKIGGHFRYIASVLS